MKKLFIATAALASLASTAAFAEVNLNVDIGGPAYVAPAPVYVAPAPVYVAPAPAVVVVDPHHRHMQNDQLYWQEQRERAAWEHAHPGGHWDHDRWAHEHHK